MSTTGLSHASDTTRLVIPDLDAGLNFLSRLPLANPLQSEVSLNQFFDSLLQSPPAGARARRAAPPHGDPRGDRGGAGAHRPLTRKPYWAGAKREVTVGEVKSTRGSLQRSSACGPRAEKQDKRAAEWAAGSRRPRDANRQARPGPCSPKEGFDDEFKDA
jgi:hypothetical protein